MDERKNQDHLRENDNGLDLHEAHSAQVQHPDASVGESEINVSRGTSIELGTGVTELHYAGFWMRFWAYLADLVIIGSLTRIVVSPIFKAFDGGLFDFMFFSAATVAEVIIFYLYFVLMTKYFGQTLGKMIFGLQVISLKEDRLTWGTLIFREFIGRFISKFTSIGYLLVGILPKKQGLHDIFADTTVVLIRR